MAIVQQYHVNRINELLEQLEDIGETDSAEYKNLTYLRDCFVEGLLDEKTMDVTAWRNAVHTWSNWWEDPDFGWEADPGWAQ